MSKIKSLYIMATLLLTLAHTNAKSIEKLVRYNYDVELNIVIHTPVHGDSVRGDVLFLHGYGERANSQKALFKKLNKSGLRVISFDLPNHGSTKTGLLWDLDNVDFNDLYKIALDVVFATQRDINRPLHIVGSSLGGLIALRMSQVVKSHYLSKRLRSVTLLNPWVSPKTCMGNELCNLQETHLSHDIKGRYIYPNFPLARSTFFNEILSQSKKARRDNLTKDVNYLVILGSDSDKIIYASESLKWFEEFSETKGLRLAGYKCPSARHDLSNEPPEHGGDQVKDIVSHFLLGMNVAENKLLYPGPCQLL